MEQTELCYLTGRCWAEIDLDAFCHNFEQIQHNAGKASVCAVIKADAYGHGDLVVANLLSSLGAAWFAAAALPEALRLRRHGITTPILLLGYTDPAQAPLLAQYNITQALFSLDYAKALSAAALPGHPVPCHLKVDTGMGRIGFDMRRAPQQALQQMEQCYALKGIRITGIFQHFAVADSLAPADIAYTEQQHALFCQAVDTLKANGHSFKTCHCCNSAAQLLHPEWGMDLVRAGVILYGCQPSSDVPLQGYRQTMTVKTRISYIKELDPGESISYGCTFTASKPMRIATCCIGYADGYPRSLSSKGVLTIHGKPAPVVGRVCMDQLMVDVTDIPEAKPQDEVIVFGPGQAGDSVDDIAQKAGTINYEILCGMSRRMPRLYLVEGKPASAVDYLQG